MQERSDAEAVAEAGIQAHFGRPSKFGPREGEAQGRTKDWSIFFFFRVLKQAELQLFLARLGELRRADSEADAARRLSDLGREIGNPGLIEAGAVEEAAARARATAGPAGSASRSAMPDDPADAFLSWLSLAVDGDAEGLARTIEAAISALVPPEQGKAPQRRARGAEAQVTGLIGRLVSALRTEQEDSEFARALKAIRDAVNDILDARRNGRGEAGRAAVRGGLIGICVQEILRQVEPALAKGDSTGRRRTGIVRAESLNGAAGAPSGHYDKTPINVAFTFKGLEALKLDPDTLATFPDAFREGMAARASRLGDTGPSAPEHWYGELGQPCIHGYLSGGFRADSGGGDRTLREKHWRGARAEVRDFNERTPEGQFLRTVIGSLFRLFGMEIVHIELGQDPYLVTEDGGLRRLPWRTEHFGFRDGLSQPFVDLGLGMAAPGGGTPRRDRTWSPAAPGEIFLGLPDEDGQRALEPCHALLRDGGTYLVFRKLEQDVAGFRNFLASQRPGDSAAQHKLAAEIVGRWPNGAPLVRAPDRELAPHGGDLNDFLYAADDPKGRRCPLGAHVRRCNPRDIGGRDDVKRHRILRRSISYGGPLLAEGSLGDGEERGLLFIAANARIDLQFEVIQGDWMNSGEFLGQAGLGRCPLTGANAGRLEDQFLEAGQGTPIAHLPRFVVTRGGDYFFLPSVHALRAMAAGDRFDLDPAVSHEMPYRGHMLADAATSELFVESRLREYAGRILRGPERSVCVTMPDSSWSPETGAGEGAASDPSAASVRFVGLNADAWAVLDGRDPATGELAFSVEHYATSSRRLTRHIEFIIGTDHDDRTGPARLRQKQLLDDAWADLDAMLLRATGGKSGVRDRLDDIVRTTLNASLRRTCQSGRIDLVHDLATEASYRVSAELMGVPGPEGLTELALALPLAKRRIAEAPRDWLKALEGRTTDNPRLVTLQLWSALIFAEVVGNVHMRRDLAGLAQQAASEFFGHLDEVVATARAYSAGRLPTLVDAFIARAPADDPGAADRHYTDVRVLLAELSGSAIGIIPGVFGAVMEALMEDRIDLQRILPVLEQDPPYWPGPGRYPLRGVEQLIYETTRRKPSAPLLMRRCLRDTILPSGAKVFAGEWVGVLVTAAGLDPAAFRESAMFSLHPWLNGPARPAEKYFLFGAHRGDRQCWGRDRMALEILSQCVRAAGRLPGLHRIAGSNRGFELFAGSRIGLKGRFAPFQFSSGL